MNSYEVFLQWKKYFEDDKNLLKELSKYESIDLSETDFFHSCKVVNNKIVSEYGVGMNKINKLTIRLFFYAFTNYFLRKSENKEIVFIASNDSNTCKKLIKDLTFMKNEKIKLVTFDNFEGYDKKIFNEAVKKIKAKLGLYIQESIYNSNIINIYFVDENGQVYDNQTILDFLKLTNSVNPFDFEINEKESILFVDNTKLIEIFIDKIYPLYVKQLDTNKTKIAISNNNKGVTSVLSKLIGKLDFSYIINNKSKVKNIFEYSTLDDNKIKKIYKDEIRYARKKKCNILITYNANGTALFIFLVYKTNVVFLNETLITLMFLHNFLNDLFLRNKKIAKLYIASNCEPIQSIKNLIKKYNLDFQIKNNHNFSNKDNEEDKYLLYYWNIYNQYIFGEKKNIDFSIYHLIIKLLEILNFYNLQNNAKNNLIANLNQMYGSYYEVKLFSNFNLKQIENRMKKLISSQDKQTYLKIKKINEFDLLSDEEEKTIYTIDLKGDINVIIKYNFIFKKMIFIYRIKNKKMNSFINYSHFIYKKNSKKLFKHIFS